MIKRIYYTVSLFAALFAVGCSESLEETYDEFAGDGMIRYVGKCSDVEVNPGWERLQVVWKNNIDAGVKKVKITYQSENESEPVVRYEDPCDPDSEDLMDTVYLEGLGDALYTVRVSNVTADDRESLVEEKYGRPYTSNHEDLRSFTRGLSAFSRMGDRLAVVVDQDNENIDTLLLCFRDVTGKEHTWNIKEHMTDTLSYEYWGMDVDMGQRDYMFLLPEDPNVKIDFNQPLTIKRKGRLQGCVDKITFDDETLNLNERLWSTAFSQLMLGKYGSGWESEMERIETLELDYDMPSMMDLIYLPNLKKVVLGKNRYIAPEQVAAFTSTTDEYVGLMVLQFLKSTRENFTVERYNNHYFFGMDDMYNTYIEAYQLAGKLDDDFALEEKGSTNLDEKPAYVAIDTTDWEVTCSDTTHNGYKKNGAAWLLHDGLRHVVIDYGYWVDEYDEEVYFEPAQTLGASVVNVTFDMKSNWIVEGFKVRQPTRNEDGDTDYLLSSLTIEFSTDGYSWTRATNTDGSATIGNSPGEETYIPVPKEMQTPVRYIRLTMSNRPVSQVSGQGLYNLRLGKFIPCTVQE